MFKPGQKVRVKKEFWKIDVPKNNGMSDRLLQEKKEYQNSIFTVSQVYDDGCCDFEDLDYTFHENWLEPITKTMDDLEVGDVLVEELYKHGENTVVNKHEILGICGKVYFISLANNYTEATVRPLTLKELKKRFTLETQEEDTIEVAGKKYKKEDVVERLKELKEIE